MAYYFTVAVLFVSAGLAACGGSDAPSKAEFAESADRICRDADKELENIGEDVGSAEEAAAAIDKVIDEARQASDELVDLDRPEGDAGQTAEQFVERFRTELNEQIVPALEELRDAIKKNDVQAAQEAAANLQKLESSQSDRYARELGANACVG